MDIKANNRQYYYLKDIKDNKHNVFDAKGNIVSNAEIIKKVMEKVNEKTKTA